MKNAELELIFEDPDEALTLSDLSIFFFHFRVMYGAAVATIGTAEIGQGQSLDDAQIDRVANAIVAAGNENVRTDFTRDLQSAEIFVERISKNSPMEIVLSGIAIALVAAVILSGGSIDVAAPGFKIKAKLGSLGKGIVSLKDALEGKAGKRVGKTARKVETKKDELK